MNRRCFFCAGESGHEVVEEGFYTFSVANDEDVDDGGTGGSTQYAVDIKIERRKLPLSSSIPISSLPCLSPHLVREKRCPFAPQQYRERLINSRLWVVMQRYERSYQGPTHKDWRGIERTGLLGKMNLESVPCPRISNRKPPFIEALTEKNVARGVLVTEVHIRFIILYIELVLCIERE